LALTSSIANILQFDLVGLRDHAANDCLNPQNFSGGATSPM